MPGPKPNKLHEELDALLDGRPVELTDELAPLAEVADALRAELAAYQLDPGVAERHVERVLEGSGTVVRMPKRQPGGWDLRRRLAAVALAAALVLAPATMASAAALPGQAMYPFKRAIEQLRIVSVQWSPPREAGERTRVAQERLEELDRLVELQMFSQIPSALSALEDAVRDAQAAVSDAGEDGQPVPSVLAKLNLVKVVGGRVVQKVVDTVADQPYLPPGTRNAITTAVRQSQDVLPPPDRQATPSETPTLNPAPSPPPSTPPGPGPDTGPPPPSSGPAPEPPTTDPTPPTTTTTPPTTAPPTTQPPPTTEATAPPAPGGGGETPGGEQAGADGKSGGDGGVGTDSAPPSTIAAP
jgi:hypothetical protein